MSRVFGELKQLGYVVRDIHAAMKYWHEVNGVGPWFYIDLVPMAVFEYMGLASSLEMSIALSYSGNVQVEFIQPRNDAPSLYKCFLDAGQEGLQHIGYFPQDYEAAKAQATAQGLIKGQEGSIAGRGDFIYYQAGGHHGSCVELVEFNAYRQFQFAEMERICRAWDGRNPIRTTLPAQPG